MGSQHLSGKPQSTYFALCVLVAGHPGLSPWGQHLTKGLRVPGRLLNTWPGLILFCNRNGVFRAPPIDLMHNIYIKLMQPPACANLTTPQAYRTLFENPTQANGTLSSLHKILRILHCTVIRASLNPTQSAVLMHAVGDAPTSLWHPFGIMPKLLQPE